MDIPSLKVLESMLDGIMNSPGLGDGVLPHGRGWNMMIF